VTGTRRTKRCTDRSGVTVFQRSELTRPPRQVSWAFGGVRHVWAFSVLSVRLYDYKKKSFILAKNF